MSIDEQKRLDEFVKSVEQVVYRLRLYAESFKRDPGYCDNPACKWRTRNGVVDGVTRFLIDQADILGKL